MREIHIHTHEHNYPSAMVSKEMIDLNNKREKKGEEHERIYRDGKWRNRSFSLYSNHL